MTVSEDDNYINSQVTGQDDSDPLYAYQNISRRIVMDCLSEVPETLKTEVAVYYGDYEGIYEEYINSNYMVYDTAKLFGLPRSQQITGIRKSIEKVRNNAINQIRRNYEKDVVLFREGKKGGKYSPYNALLPAIELGTLTSDAVHRLINDNYEKWMEEALKEADALGTTLISYPYISLYKESSATYYSKWMDNDIKSCIQKFFEKNANRYNYSVDIIETKAMFGSGLNLSKERKRYSEAIDYAVQNNIGKDELYADIKEEVANTMRSEGFRLYVAGKEEQMVFRKIVTDHLRQVVEGIPYNEMGSAGQLVDICNIIYDKGPNARYSKQEYEKAKQTMEVLRNIILRSINNMKSTALFNEVYTEWTSTDPEKYGTAWSAQLSPKIVSELISRHITLIDREDIKKLDSESGLEELFYAKLRRDRIHSLYIYQNEVTNYRYFDFLRIASVSARTKKAKIEAYVRCLERFKNTQILIKDYSVNRKASHDEPMFTICWLEITEEERYTVVVNSVGVAIKSIEEGEIEI